MAISVISTVSGSGTDHRSHMVFFVVTQAMDQHGPQLQYSQTQTWLLVATWTTELTMVSGGNLEHSHQRGLCCSMGH